MSQTTRTPEQERNIDLFRRVVEEGFNRGNLAPFDGPFTPDFQKHQRGFLTPDLNGLKRGIQALRRTLPDLRLEIVDTIAQDDKVCFRLVGTGAH
jgi:hypothetical protein